MMVTVAVVVAGDHYDFDEARVISESYSSSLNLFISFHFSLLRRNIHIK